LKSVTIILFCADPPKGKGVHPRMKSTPEKVIHGGNRKNLEEKFGIPFIDFSASLNPFPPQVSWSPEQVSLESYPDDSYCRLKETIGRLFHREVEEITVGNGSIELIRTFCSCVLKPGDQVQINSPTFGEYEYSAFLAGARCDSSSLQAKVRFLCNPNNPTGRLINKPELRVILDQIPPETYLFLDEAFIELADPAQSMVTCRHEGLFVARSLTKSFAVPGIRFGYGFGSAELVAQMEAVRPPWTVNAYAEAFTLQAFHHYHLLEESRRAIARERSWLGSRFQELGIRSDPSDANFLLLRLPSPAASLVSALCNRGILVRDCSSFGLPAAVRVAVRTRAENQMLVEAFQACLP
jgi:threonine-phosphate decarboxylase